MQEQYLNIDVEVNAEIAKQKGIRGRRREEAGSRGRNEESKGEEGGGNSGKKGKRNRSRRR